MAGEGRVRLDVDLDVEVTGGPPPGPTSPCPASCTRVPWSTPAGILTVSVRRERTRPSPEHSRHGSGMIEPKPRQAAHGRRVRISPRNERCTSATSPWPWQVSHGDGRGAGRGALAWQASQRQRGVDLELPGDAEGRLGQLDVEPDQGVLAAPCPRARSARGAAGGRTAAEERVHDVGEREALAGTAEALAERVAAPVVRRPLLRVAEHLVGAGDVLEALLRLRVGVDVGVQLAGQPAVGLLDVVGARRRGRRRGSRRGPGSLVSFVEDPGDVARDGAYGRHGSGVVHAGGPDHAERAEVVRPAVRSRWRRRWSRRAGSRGLRGRCGR